MSSLDDAPRPDGHAPAPGKPPRRRGWSAVAPLLLLLIALAPGCATVSHSTVATVGGETEGARLDDAPEPERIAALTGEIRGLSPTVDPTEAARLAAHAIRYSTLLAETYGMHKPVELHNVLVNLHLKPRGLCYQLADDMQAELVAQHYRTLTFRRGIAWRDDLWNEHNCVVVTAIGQPFEDGLVLDAWRNAGVLRWARVRNDHYPWVLRTPAVPALARDGADPDQSRAGG